MGIKVFSNHVIVIGSDKKASRVEMFVMKKTCRMHGIIKLKQNERITKKIVKFLIFCAFFNLLEYFEGLNDENW